VDSRHPLRQLAAIDAVSANSFETLGGDGAEHTPLCQFTLPETKVQRNCANPTSDTARDRLVSAHVIIFVIDETNAVNNCVGGCNRNRNRNRRSICHPSSRHAGDLTVNGP